MLKSLNNRNLKLLKKVRTLAFINILLGLVRKNLKLLLRSKSSALIVLLGPLLIIGLVGAAFNTTNFYNINVGTYSGYYNDLTLSVIQELEDKQFNVVKTETKEDCISRIKRGDLHLCAVFPDDMKVGSEEGVKFYVDKTRMNLVWVIIDSISSKISTRSSELSKEMTSVLLTTLDETKGLINEKQSSVVGAIESNLEINREIEGFSSDLNEADLTYSTSDLGLDKIRSRASSTLSSLNASQSQIESVLDAISETENKSYEASRRINNASIIIEHTVSNMGLLGTSVRDSLDAMHQVASVLTTIAGKINTIEFTEAETIVTPIKTSIEPVISEKTHLNNMFPTLLILIVMFIGLLLSSTLVIREKTSSSYFRNFITPTGDGLFILSDYLTNTFVLFLQLLVVFLVSLIFFKEALYSVLFNSFVVLFLIVSVFVMLGMLIGQIFSSEEMSTLGAISIGSILLFFSSTILPLETLPESIRNIAYFNPFVLGESMLKEVMLFNVDLFVLVEPMVISLVYIAALSLFVVCIRKWSKRFL